MLSGIYQVETSSSTYIFDFTSKQFQRIGKEATSGYYYHAPLRKDNNWISFESVSELEVGKPVQIFSQGISDEPDVITVRTTTPVVGITNL